ncbi:MAG: ATP-binding cassette domain-containing protein [Bacteroidia bacterium]|nr:ATP-binding cassette domain-containing protein [Bacteroidia bacterium]
MSEEILQALMQLFAIIVKQDEGLVIGEREYVKKFLSHQLNNEAVELYLKVFDEKIGPAENEGKKEEKDTEREKKPKLTSVKDSVKILGICKKINKTLTQKQKIVVLVRLFELVNTDKKFTEQRMAIINTVSEVFKFNKDEFESIQNYVINDDPKGTDNPNLLIINDKEDDHEKSKFIKTEKIDKSIFILRVVSVDLYFLKYLGNEDLFLNGLGILKGNLYLFANGSTVKLPKGKPIYYSDVVSKFLAETTEHSISFNARNIEYRFPGGDIGIQNVNLSECHSHLIGIMGASGTGKTTLLNVLSGIEAPSSGDVIINGLNLHKEKKKFEGVIGYIPQDDLLIEELTVFQNLYYNAKLCFRNKSETEINELIDKVLTNLGLLERKALKVGSPMKKLISGGQRKRLNIALELIRQPLILFVDEPTSGLSSRDSENVMDLLRELVLKGKLIFVVIHQPSSDIFKVFDKIIILDEGGHQIYYGNPVESVMYFKKIDAQINSEVGECSLCGSVNPELIFNIIDAKVVDEFGNYTDKRKVSSEQWQDLYKKNVFSETIRDILLPLPSSLKIPGWIKQLKIYLTRDFYSKISNKQYVLLTLLESPILAFILSYIIRYIANPDSTKYIFRENENIPPYIFMCIIVALFLGLTISAEEIFRDRKILKRERFLNLSRSAYLMSKIFILFGISAIQCFLFVFIGNFILGIRMNFEYFIALFSISAFANLLGLNISASFNSVITIYILIPLLMIPQMILGGAMFSFDKLNRTIGSVDKVPWVAELMASKWAYEALLVHQYKNNRYERISSKFGTLFDIEKQESMADFKQVWYLPKLTEKVNEIYVYINDTGSNRQHKIIENNFDILKNELFNEMKKIPNINFQYYNMLNINAFNNLIAFHTKEYIKKLTQYYSAIFNDANSKKETIINYLLQQNPEEYYRLRDDYYNESVADIVKKVFEKNKILEYNGRLIQQVDPIYQDPETENIFNFRSHFFAPRKNFFGQLIDTFWFNMIIIWLMTIILYITLYYEHLKKLINLPVKTKFK